jgi:hypothetical protein
MTSTKKKTPAERQLDEGLGTHLGGGSEGKRTTAPLAGLPAALPWAARFIRAGGPGVPGYGTPAWAALPDNDPRKVASVVLAAELHRAYWDPTEHARRPHAELDALRELDAAEVWFPEIVAEAHRTANRPTFAELSELRNEPARVELARWHERRVAEYEITGDDEGASTHAPARHIDGRPVRYRAPLGLVPTLDGGAA